MLSEADVKTLHPGDTLIMSGLVDDWSKYNGHEVTVADPPFEYISEKLFIVIELFEAHVFGGHYTIEKCDPQLVSQPVPDTKRRCTCDLMMLMRVGCSCGGV